MNFFGSSGNESNTRGIYNVQVIMTGRSESLTVLLPSVMPPFRPSVLE